MQEVNSVERVKSALRRRQPDRVPIMEFVVDARVAAAAAPGCMDAADCMDRLDMDSVSCGAHFDAVAGSGGEFTDEWGVVYQAGPEAVAHPLRGPIETLAQARAYRAPDPDADGRLGLLPELVRRYKGRRAICFHHRAAFMWSAYLMGLDNLLANLILAPDLVEIVMDKALACNMRIVRNAIRAGADVIVLGDDYAHNRGPLMSPDLFEKIILPRLKKMIDLILAEGALCIKHSDGNIYALLDMIVTAGADGINPIEPVAGMDLKTVKKLVGGSICVCGNIDCARLLPHGATGDVRQTVRRAIADAGAGGGYILTSSNSIHSSCKPENFAAMVMAGKEFGRY